MRQINKLVVENLATSKMRPKNGSQADHIADVAVTGTYATDDTPIETAINAILAALEGVGIVADS